MIPLPLELELCPTNPKTISWCLLLHVRHWIWQLFKETKWKYEVMLFKTRCKTPAGTYIFGAGVFTQKCGLCFSLRVLLWKLYRKCLFYLTCSWRWSHRQGIRCQEGGCLKLVSDAVINLTCTNNFACVLLKLSGFLVVTVTPTDVGLYWRTTGPLTLACAFCQRLQSCRRELAGLLTLAISAT